MATIFNSVNQGNAASSNAVVTEVRNPKVTDFNYQIGQVWINTVTEDSFTLVAFNTGVPVWQANGGGGTGIFNALTVNPGPTNLTGNLTVNGGIVGIAGSNIAVVTPNLSINGAATTVNGTTISLTATGELDLLSSGKISFISDDPSSTAFGFTNVDTTGGMTFVSGTNGIEMTTTSLNDRGIILDSTGNGGGIAIGTSQSLGSVAVADIPLSIDRTLSMGLQTSMATAFTEIINLCTGGVSDAGATRIVNIATGTTTGTKRVNIGNSDGLTDIFMDGAIDINGPGGSGATVIGNVANATATVNIAGGTTAAVAVSHVNQTIASPTIGVTNNVRVGTILLTGFTTAASASLIVTLSNSFIATGSECILATITFAGTNNAQLTLLGTNTFAGGAVLTILNNGSQAVNGNIQINFWVMS